MENDKGMNKNKKGDLAGILHFSVPVRTRRMRRSRAARN